MRKKRGFTLIELLVVVAILALLVSIIMPALKMAKITANRIMCRANLKQWGMIWKNYTTEFDDEFPWGNWGINSMGDVAEDGTWLISLVNYYESYKIRFCPTAVKDNNTELGTFPTKTWGPKTEEWISTHENHFKADPYTFKGSYGINDFIHKPDNPNKLRRSGKHWTDHMGPEYEKKFWGTSVVSNGSEVPLMFDCDAYKMLPANTNRPPPGRTQRGNSKTLGQLRLACVDRHGNDTVNHLFLDWSVRSVGLKELWVLKWDRYWEPCIPPNAAWEWPEWMKHMKDYY